MIETMTAPPIAALVSGSRRACMIDIGLVR
jgi:hypothetical protein